MLIKIHRSYRNVVAICDNNLIGKKFEDGKKQLDVRESFYKGQEVELDELKRIMILQIKEDCTFNIIGKESIRTAIETGIISEEQVRKVANIPFALTLI